MHRIHVIHRTSRRELASPVAACYVLLHFDIEGEQTALTLCADLPLLLRGRRGRLCVRWTFLAGTLSCPGPFVGPSSLRNSVVLAIVIATEAVVAVGPSRVASNLPCTAGYQQIKGERTRMTKMTKGAHHCRHAMTTVEASLRGRRVEVELLADGLPLTGPVEDGKAI